MGDKHRIVKSKDRKFSDSSVETLLRVDPNKLGHDLSPFFTRPVYQYTKAECGGHERWHT